MTHSHGMDGPSHQSFRVVDTAVHNTEFGLSAGLDYNAVHLVINGRHQADWVNGIADSGQFRMQIYEVNRKLHKGGLLPHLHIAVDDQNGGHFMPRSGVNPMQASDTPYQSYRNGQLHPGGYGRGLHHHHRRAGPPSLKIVGDLEINNAYNNNAINSGDNSAPNYNGGRRQSAFIPDMTIGDREVIPGFSGHVSNQANEGAPYTFASYHPGQAQSAVIPDLNFTYSGPATGAWDQACRQGDWGPQYAYQGTQSTDQGTQPADQGAQTALQRTPPGDQGLQWAVQGTQPTDQGARPSDNPTVVPVAHVPDSLLTMSGAPTITPEKINEVLKEYHSPAAGMGQYIYDEGVKHGINPAMALAFYVVESSCGTKGLAVQNKSWGNVRGHGPHGYRPYDSIKDSLDQWYDLINRVYHGKFHVDKLAPVIAHYSPNSDGNNEAAYVRKVGQLVRSWQSNPAPGPSI